MVALATAAADISCRGSLPVPELLDSLDICLLFEPIFSNQSHEPLGDFPVSSCST
jgi:hypothetical protein